MLTYVVRRFLWACVLFLAVTIVTYVIFFVVPANPAQLVAGKSATAADIKRAEHFLGIATLSIITITFIVDLTYAWIDPRVRLS